VSITEQLVRRGGAERRQGPAPAPPARLASPARLRYADLGATVHLGYVPEGLADELPGLYSNLFSTLDFFLCRDRKSPNGACVLEEPRHVILFRREGGTVDILNNAFRCEPEEANRICSALFRAMPGVHRLHLDVMFPPRELAFPRRVRERLDRMVIDLPDTVDEYYHSLGKKTRKKVRFYQNRLRRAFPDVKSETVKPGERSRELVDRLAEWKIQRYRLKGLLTYWEIHPVLAERLSNLIRRRGEARITTIAGREAAIDICFRVGETAYAYESANDPRYDQFSLGFLTFYWSVCSAIESGAARLDALEGTEWSKTPLGAQPVRTTSLSVFRSQLSRLRLLDEALRIERERYYRAWHAVGQKMRQYPRGRAFAEFVTRRRRKKLTSA
jgi:hypothetical protein